MLYFNLYRLHSCLTSTIWQICLSPLYGDFFLNSLHISSGLTVAVESDEGFEVLVREEGSVHESWTCKQERSMLTEISGWGDRKKPAGKETLTQRTGWVCEKTENSENESNLKEINKHRRATRRRFVLKVKGFSPLLGCLLYNMRPDASHL